MGERLLDERARKLEFKGLGTVCAATNSKLEVHCEWLRRRDTCLIFHKEGNFHTLRVFTTKVREVSSYSLSRVAHTK